MAAADDGVVVKTTRGDLSIGSSTLDWGRLSDEVRRRIGQSVEPEPVDDREVTIPPETVAGWLGLGDGQVLLLTANTARSTVLLVLGFTAILLLSGLKAVLFHSWVFVVSGLVCCAFLLAAMARQRREGGEQRLFVSEVRASGEALEVRCQQCWRSISWGALQGVKPGVWGTHILSTTTGDVILPQWFDKRRLLPAIERAIDARQQGEVLPRVLGGDVPEAALSRATADAAVAERGVSRIEGL